MPASIMLAMEQESSLEELLACVSSLSTHSHTNTHMMRRRVNSIGQLQLVTAPMREHEPNTSFGTSRSDCNLPFHLPFKNNIQALSTLTRWCSWLHDVTGFICCFPGRKCFAITTHLPVYTRRSLVVSSRSNFQAPSSERHLWRVSLYMLWHWSVATLMPWQNCFQLDNIKQFFSQTKFIYITWIYYVSAPFHILFSCSLCR